MNTDEVRRVMTEIETLWPGLVSTWPRESLERITRICKDLTVESGLSAVSAVAANSTRWRPDPAAFVRVLSDVGEPDPNIKRLPPPPPPKAVPWAEVSQELYGEYVPIADHLRRVREEPRIAAWASGVRS